MTEKNELHSLDDFKRVSHHTLEEEMWRIEAVLAESAQLRGEVKSMEKCVSELRPVVADLLKAEAKLTSQSLLIEKLAVALKKAQPYVLDVWEDTKGTEREGTAMGAAGVLRAIDELLALITQKEGE